jgi:hypothetical protein
MKKAEKPRRFTTSSYVTVSNYSVFVGIYVVSCLTARSVDNFKF